MCVFVRMPSINYGLCNTVVGHCYVSKDPNWNVIIFTFTTNQPIHTGVG